MEHKEITSLADAYKQTLLHERDARMSLAVVQAEAEQVKVKLIHDANTSGAIDGKNAEIRANQEKLILAEDEEYNAALKDVGDWQANVSLAEVERKHAEAVISLTRSWLRSQGGVI